MDKEKPLILIVDDNITNLDLLVNTLKNKYKLGVAKNGVKALEYINKFKPDLILLDIMMPEMDGYEVCTKIKNNEDTKSIPVIFLSAMNELEDKNKGLAMGAIDYLTKPFNVNKILTRVEECLKE